MPTLGASKRQRIAVPPEVPTGVPEKVSPLLQLPPEVLDQVFSYLVVIPWHPENGMWGNGMWGGGGDHFLGRNVMRINHVIRKQCIDLVVRNTLWVHVKYSRAACKRLRRHSRRLPILPKPFRSALPNKLPGLHLEFGQPEVLRQTRSFREEDANFIFAFNFQSIALLVGTLIGSSRDVQCLTIWQDHLSPQLELVITQQIHSLIPLLRHDLDVTVFDSNQDRTVYSRQSNHELTNSFPRADELMSIVLNLDAHGRKLEATLLCMHYNFVLFSVTSHDPYIGHEDEFAPLITGPLIAWAGNTGSLSQPGWETEPNNIERTRRARTLHYLEYRACLGYTAGVEAYGYDFALVNYVEVANLLGLRLGSPRWVRDNFDVCYGLPNFELAQMHHARALIYWHRSEYYLSMIDDGSLIVIDGVDSDTNQITSLICTYYAWLLDMNNKTYSRFLRRLAKEAEPLLVQDAMDYILTGHDTEDAKRFAVDLGLLAGWCINGDTKQSFTRAQQTAKAADVAYDQRRGDEFPVELDPDERRHKQNRLLKLDRSVRYYSTDCIYGLTADMSCGGDECFHCSGGFDLSVLRTDGDNGDDGGDDDGDNDEDSDSDEEEKDNGTFGQRFSDVAPWLNWTL